MTTRWRLCSGEWHNSQAAVECLLAAGALCDIREGTHHATPVGSANHAGHAGVRDLLLDHSHDKFDLAHFGRRDQIAALLDDDSALAAATAPSAAPPEGEFQDATPRPLAQ